MHTVLKYKLDTVKTQTIGIPQEATFLDVQVQNGTPCLWARVNPDLPKIKYTFITVGDGHDINEEVGQYIGTYQEHGGTFGWHVFVDV